jgi:hypothetical protein
MYDRAIEMETADGTPEKMHVEKEECGDGRHDRRGCMGEEVSSTWRLLLRRMIVTT